MRTWFHTLLIGLMAAMLSACKDENAQNQNGAMTVEVSPPLREEIIEYDEYTGRFRASNRVEIRARVSGYLDEIRFKDGQRVKAGDVLFVIDQRPFRIALERAQAQYDIARKEFERYRKLRKTNAVSQQQLDERELRLREATAARDEALLNMEFTEVKSPIDGRVSRHRIDIGNLVTGGDMGAQLLTTVVTEDPIHFYVEASEKEILKYEQLAREGKRESSRNIRRKVAVKLINEDQFLHEGYIDFVDNEVDLNTGTIQGRAVLANPEGVLIPGIFGRMRIAGSGEYEAMLVPDRLIGTNQNRKFVYVVDDNNQVAMKPVETGPLHNEEYRVIRSGLSENDRIIQSGIARLRPGMAVNPQPAGQGNGAQAPGTPKQGQ